MFRRQMLPIQNEVAPPVVFGVHNIDHIDMNHDLKVVLKVDTMRNKCILAKSFPKRITCKLLQQQKLLVVIKEKGGGNVLFGSDASWSLKSWKECDSITRPAHISLRI